MEIEGKIAEQMRKATSFADEQDRLRERLMDAEIQGR
jgi:hypothetical protein